MEQLKLNKKAFTIVFAVFSILTLSSFLIQQPWKAPASADSKKSAVASDASTIAAGKELYIKHCQSCHGKKGKGDGPSSKDLDIPAGDFTKASTQSQSDGALNWKITEGRKPMPSFKKKLNETQVWQVIAFMRTLK